LTAVAILDGSVRNQVNFSTDLPLAVSAAADVSSVNWQKNRCIASARCRRALFEHSPQARSLPPAYRIATNAIFDTCLVYGTVAGDASVRI